MHRVMIMFERMVKDTIRALRRNQLPIRLLIQQGIGEKRGNNTHTMEVGL